MINLKAPARCVAAGDPPLGFLTPPESERPGPSSVARKADDMTANSLTNGPRRARAAVGAVLTLDDAGRAAARRHMKEGRGRVMPTPCGLFDNWATRPKVTP